MFIIFYIFINHKPVSSWTIGEGAGVGDMKYEWNDMGRLASSSPDGSLPVTTIIRCKLI